MQPDLPRRIGFWGASAIMVGVTIGTGIFRRPGDIAAHTASPALVLTLWTIGGLLSLCGALTYAEMAAMHPQTGGVYVFLRMGLGRAVAFVFGWTYMLITKPFAAAGIAVIFGESVVQLLNLKPSDHALLVNAITTGALVALTVINVRGVRESTGLATLLTGLKIAALLAITGVCFAVPGGSASNFAPGPSPEPFRLALAPIMLAVLWTYDGWSDVGSIAGEVQDPQRQLPRIYLIGTAAITLLYLAANVAYIWVVPLAAQRGREVVAADAMERLLGTAPAAMMAAIVAVSALGASHAAVMTGARVTFAQSRDGLLFRFLSRVHPRYQTPAVSLWFQLAMSVAALWYNGSFKKLADGFTFTMWIFYGLAACSIFILRRREPGTPRPYRCWGYPFTPAVFITAALAMTILTIYGDVASPESRGRTTLPWIGVLLAGLPVYYIWRFLHPEPEGDARISD